MSPKKTITVETKFFKFRQNNSGGSFYHDEEAGIGIDVIIEAQSAAEANRIAEGLGLDFSGQNDCPCCGNRWHEVWDGDGTEVPTIYNIDVSNGILMPEFGISLYDGINGYIHYIDGSKKTIKYVDKRSNQE